MKFVAQQFTIDGFKIAEREYRTEKGAWKVAGEWRLMFPLAPIKVIFRAENHIEHGAVYDVPMIQK